MLVYIYREYDIELDFINNINGHVQFPSSTSHIVTAPKQPQTQQ